MTLKLVDGDVPEIDEPKKLKRVMIVIEENGQDNGKGFWLKVEGDIGEIQFKTKEEDLSPAEFWGMTLFRVCVESVKMSEALKEERNE